VPSAALLQSTTIAALLAASPLSAHLPFNIQPPAAPAPPPASLVSLPPPPAYQAPAALPPPPYKPPPTPPASLVTPPTRGFPSGTHGPRRGSVSAKLSSGRGWASVPHGLVQRRVLHSRRLDSPRRLRMDLAGSPAAARPSIPGPLHPLDPVCKDGGWSCLPFFGIIHGCVRRLRQAGARAVRMPSALLRHLRHAASWISLLRRSRPLCLDGRRPHRDRPFSHGSVPPPPQRSRAPQVSRDSGAHRVRHSPGTPPLGGRVGSP
jgi:hypothetical protein